MGTGSETRALPAPATFQNRRSPSRAPVRISSTPPRCPAVPVGLLFKFARRGIVAGGLGGARRTRVLTDRLSLAEVGKLFGADLDEVGQLIELGYLPEWSRDGSVSMEAFLVLLGRSLSNPRLQRLRIAEPLVWAGVFARNPGLLREVVRLRCLPGSLGEVVQLKLLRDD